MFRDQSFDTPVKLKVWRHVTETIGTPLGIGSHVIVNPVDKVRDLNVAHGPVMKGLAQLATLVDDSFENPGTVITLAH